MMRLIMRKAPNPSTKLQRNLNPQAPFELLELDLELSWKLELGIWNFHFPASLTLWFSCA